MKDEEWQEAVDGAEFLLTLDAARQYGLITGGPKVNVARCLKIRSEGQRRGIRPSPDCIQRLTDQMLCKD